MTETISEQGVVFNGDVAAWPAELRKYNSAREGLTIIDGLDALHDALWFNKKNNSFLPHGEHGYVTGHYYMEYWGVEGPIWLGGDMPFRAGVVHGDKPYGEHGGGMKAWLTPDAERERQIPVELNHDLVVGIGGVVMRLIRQQGERGTLQVADNATVQALAAGLSNFSLR